ncbi:MAG: YceI family protein [Pseudomonadota bacterium]
MIRHLFGLIAAAIAVSSCAPESAEPTLDTQIDTPAGRWIVNSDESRLGFSATQNNEAFDGEFESFRAEIDFDPDDLENARISVAVDMTSAKTGDRQRDSALPGGDWFKAREFPEAEFLSTDITRSADGNYTANGSLTIRDMTKEISLPFSLAIDGDVADAAGEITLVRTDFGVGRGEFSEGKWVGLDVGVSFQIVATR